MHTHAFRQHSYIHAYALSNIHTYSDGHIGGNLGFKYLAQENLGTHAQGITNRLIEYEA